MLPEQKLDALLARHQAVEAELGEAEHRWLELAGELDELDA